MAASANILNIWPEFKDEEGRRNWQLMHYLRHKTYEQAAAMRGVSIPTPDMLGSVDSDWYYQHWLVHSQYDSALGTGLGDVLLAIDVADVSNPADYDDFQSNNAYLHASIEQALGIS